MIKKEYNQLIQQKHIYTMMLQKKTKKQKNLNWSQVPDHAYR